MRCRVSTSQPASRCVDHSQSRRCVVGCNWVSRLLNTGPGDTAAFNSEPNRGVVLDRSVDGARPKLARGRRCPVQMQVFTLSPTASPSGQRLAYANRCLQPDRGGTAAAQGKTPINRGAALD